MKKEIKKIKSQIQKEYKELALIQENEAVKLLEHFNGAFGSLVEEDPAFLNEIKKLTREEYVQEIKGEFLDIGDALIPNSLIMEAITDGTPRGRVRY